MRDCLKCENEIPSRIVIDGKERNLGSRKYCLDCSPFMRHNTKKLEMAELSNGVVEGRKKCCLCGETKPSSDFRHRYGDEAHLLRAMCKICDNQLNYKFQKKRGMDRKASLIEKFGGKCMMCGYSENSSALHFHHRDPKEKLFELSTADIRTREINAIVEEAKKCDLLCSNCHMEAHYPHLNDLL